MITISYFINYFLLQNHRLKGDKREDFLTRLGLRRAEYPKDFFRKIEFLYILRYVTYFISVMSGILLYIWADRPLLSVILHKLIVQSIRKMESKEKLKFRSKVNKSPSVTFRGQGKTTRLLKSPQRIGPTFLFYDIVRRAVFTSIFIDLFFQLGSEN